MKKTLPLVSSVLALALMIELSAPSIALASADPEIDQVIAQIEKSQSSDELMDVLSQDYRERSQAFLKSIANNPEQANALWVDAFEGKVTYASLRKMGLLSEQQAAFDAAPALARFQMMYSAENISRMLAKSRIEMKKVGFVRLKTRLLHQLQKIRARFASSKRVDRHIATGEFGEKYLPDQVADATKELGREAVGSVLVIFIAPILMIYQLAYFMGLPVKPLGW